MYYFRRLRSGQIHSLMAALTRLRSVETNLTLTCPSPKSFVCNLPDSGRHVTRVFQGLSLSRWVGRVGENPRNEVGLFPCFVIALVLQPFPTTLAIYNRGQKSWNTFAESSWTFSNPNPLPPPPLFTSQKTLFSEVALFEYNVSTILLQILGCPLTLYDLICCIV